MSHPQKPHFLLFSQVTEKSNRHSGRWHFILEATDGDHVIEAYDNEECVGERLQLLSIVRGLEALDQPSRVTLLTNSRSINRGIRTGLQTWRANGWKLERFGRMRLIKNFDLWQRIDHALQFHQIQCRNLQIDRDPNLSQKSKQFHSSIVARMNSLVRKVVSPMTRWLSPWETHSPTRAA